MAKKKETTEEFSALRLRGMRQRIERVLLDLKQAEEVADVPLWCFRGYSAERAINMLESFATDLRRSTYAAQIGAPFSALSEKKGTEVITPTDAESDPPVKPKTKSRANVAAKASHDVDELAKLIDETAAKRQREADAKKSAKTSRKANEG